MEEKIIGTWTNGKPIYETTLTTTMVGGSDDGESFGVTDIDISELNHETIIKIKSLLEEADLKTYFDADITFQKLNYANVITHVAYDGTNKNIVRIRTNMSWWDGVTVYVTLLYTKTTDTATNTTE